MLTPYESRLGLMWLANASSRIHNRRPEAAELVEWVNEHIEELAAGIADHGNAIDAAGIAEVAAECEGVLQRRGRFDRAEQVAEGRGEEGPQAWRRLHTALRRASEATENIKLDATALRLLRLARITRLDDADLRIVEMLTRYETQPTLESLLDDVYGPGISRSFRHGGPSLKSPAFADLLGISPNTLLSRVAPDAPLVRSGLLTVDEDGELCVASRLCRLDSAPEEETDPLPLLLGTPAQAKLEWEDFDHLGQQRADVEGIVRGALSKPAKGVNVLLYGPPGTGKTEFARTLAARLEVALFGVGETDESGYEPSRIERLAELKLGQSLLRRDTGALLLFDEMDDLLRPGSSLVPGIRRLRIPPRRSRAPSRLFMARLLEENPVPTLWIANDARGIDLAILGRMMFAIEMPQPPPPVRRRIWARQLERSGIQVSTKDTRALAHDFDISPGAAARAVSAATLLPDDDLAAVRRSAQSLSHLLEGETT